MERYSMKRYYSDTITCSTTLIKKNIVEDMINSIQSKHPKATLNSVIQSTCTDVCQRQILVTYTVTMEEEIPDEV